MRFSNKAARYLTKIKRNEDFVISLDEIVNYFRGNNIPEFEKVIEFQLNFSGLELIINNDKSSKFNSFLISKKDILDNNQIEYLIIENKHYFFCGDHATAQFWFILSETGELCIYNSKNQTVNIIYDSFEKFIESYAFADLIKQNKKYEHPGYYNLLDDNLFNELTKNYFIHDSSNDKFNYWISNGNLIIKKGVWLHEHSFYLHFYGENKLECEKLIELLTREKIIN